MKLSTRARYTLRLMVAIAEKYDGDHAISLADVSKKTSISRRYLEQLAISLKKASLIVGISGKGGGYKLTRPAVKISLGQVVEAAIGPINIVDCVLNPQSCLKSDYCECRWVYQTINERVVGVLDELFLDDLVTHSRSGLLGTKLVEMDTKCLSQKNKSTKG